MTTTCSVDRNWANSRRVLHVAECSRDGVVAHFNITEAVPVEIPQGWHPPG